jgi:hypothetical protein
MTTIAELDTEISHLQAEAAAVDRMPPPIAQRFAEAEGKLREAEQVFRTYGLGVSAGHPAETAHLQRQAAIGACMVVGSAQLLAAERERIASAGEGLSQRERTERLAQLRREIERLAAQRELALRAVEGDGFLPRPVHPELLIYKQADVERLAAR